MVYITTYKKEREKDTDLVEINQVFSYEDILKGNFETVDNTIHEVEGLRYRETITIERSYNWLIASSYKGAGDIPNADSVIDAIKSISQPFLIMEDLTSCYDVFKLPKRSGGFRTIKAPKPELKEAQRRIASLFSFKLKMLSHNSAFAYTPKRSVADAVRVHQANASQWFLKIDMKNFFDNCTPEFIKKSLRTLYPFAIWNQAEYDEFADILVKVACLDNGLPQGTPLSPILTNLVMVGFDKWLTKFCFSHAMRYTRYADDLLISSKYNFKYHIVESEIKAYLEKEGYPFSVNAEKTRYGNNKGSNFNLGLMLNKDNNITIGHKNKRELKVMMHHLKISPETWAYEDKVQLRGKLEWLRSNEPEYHGKMIEWFNNKYSTDIYALLK